MKPALSTLAMISGLEIVKAEVLKNNYVAGIVLTMRMVRDPRTSLRTLSSASAVTAYRDRAANQGTRSRPRVPFETR